MKYKFGIGIYILTIVFLICSCNNDNSGNSQQENSTETNKGDLSDFYQFYQLFHKDSLYQIQHITFPLKGLPPNADSTTFKNGEFRWELQNWRMHLPYDFELGEYKREIELKGQDLVEERILHKSRPFGMLRRYAKISGEWYLIYYAGMNGIAQ